MSPAAEPWNVWAVRLIRDVCYHGKAEPIDKTTQCGMLRRDMNWLKFRLEVRRDSRETIEQALRGAALVWPTLGERPWSPAKAFSLKGTWASLYERSLTAAGKVRTVRQDTPKPFKAIYRRMLEELAQ